MIAVGLIGVGDWGPNVFRALLQHPQYEHRHVMERSKDPYVLAPAQGACDDR